MGTDSSMWQTNVDLGLRIFCMDRIRTRSTHHLQAILLWSNWSHFTLIWGLLCWSKCIKHLQRIWHQVQKYWTWASKRTPWAKTLDQWWVTHWAGAHPRSWTWWCALFGTVIRNRRYSQSRLMIASSLTYAQTSYHCALSNWCISYSFPFLFVSLISLLFLSPLMWEVFY